MSAASAKPLQPVFVIPRAKVIEIIQAWLDKKPSYCWGTAPADVINQVATLPDHDLPGHVLLSRIGNLLDKARTHKMPGNANAGMPHLLQEMRKHRVSMK